MFFLYNQNNSGGNFHEDEAAGIGPYVIVEANDANHADSRAVNIGIYFHGCSTGQDCDCCGDRWSQSYGTGDAVPSIYGEPAENMEKGWYRSYAFVHYLNGEIKKIEFKEKSNGK